MSDDTQLLRDAAAMLEAFCDALPGTDPTDYTNPKAETPHDPLWELYCHASTVWDELVDEADGRNAQHRPEVVEAARALVEKARETLTQGRVDEPRTWGPGDPEPPAGVDVLFDANACGMSEPYLCRLAGHEWEWFMSPDPAKWNDEDRMSSTWSVAVSEADGPLREFSGGAA